MNQAVCRRLKEAYDDVVQIKLVLRESIQNFLIGLNLC